jgi:DNA modification methylase
MSTNSKKPDWDEFKSFIQGFKFEEDEKRGRPTEVRNINILNSEIPQFINEFWTAKQRQAASIHEVSYRACFKPQLPAFFIDGLTELGDTVYDPFSGRGTTVIEATLKGRKGIANDINPLSEILAQPRLFPLSLEEVENRLNQISFDKKKKANIDLSMFYHPDTEGELVSLREYLETRKKAGKEDRVDKWIRMIATNRLTGHSSCYFSVYTLPPNQAVSQANQLKINEKRQQKPEYRDVKALILRKTKQLLKKITQEQRKNLDRYGTECIFLTEDARFTKEIPQASVQLTVTSPPFLNIVQYSKDNWLRCWFNSNNDQEIGKKITMSKTVEKWSAVMSDVFKELYRVTKPGGWVAFEVGEVRKGKVNLDEVVVPLGLDVGFKCFGIMINLQEFTKTSNIWGVNNNGGGTNTNRIVIFQKKER